MNQNRNLEASSIEKKVAMNLKDYFTKQTDNLGQIPINSLQNFLSRERNLTDYDRAYHFIVDNGNKNEIFIV